MRPLVNLFVASILLGLLLCFSGCREQVIDVSKPDLTSAFPEVAEFINNKALAVTKNPDSSDVWGQYAMALDAHEFDQASVLAYRKAINLSPENPRWRYFLSQKLRAVDREEAVALLTSALRNTKYPDLVRYRIGELLVEEANLSATETIFSEISAGSPYHKYAQYQLVQAYLQAADWERAEKILESLSANYQEANALQARLDLIEGDASKESSMSHDQKVLPSIFSDFEDPYLKQLYHHRRDPFYLAQQAMQRARSGDVLALRRLKKIVSKYPDLIQVRLQLANLLIDIGGLEEAIAVIQEGLSISPESPQLWALRAYCEMERQQWQQALTAIQKAIEQKPDSAEFLSDSGFILEQLNRPQEALHAYRRSLELDPTSSVVAERVNLLSKFVDPQ